MANRSTSNQWTTAAFEAANNLPAAEAALRSAENNLKTAEDAASKVSEGAVKTTLVNRVTGQTLTSYYTADDVAAAKKEVERAQQSVRDASTNVSIVQQNVNFSTGQADKAKTGEPNTQTNTPPANANPGSNTSPAQLQPPTTINDQTPIPEGTTLATTTSVPPTGGNERVTVELLFDPAPPPATPPVPVQVPDSVSDPITGLARPLTPAEINLREDSQILSDSLEGSSRRLSNFNDRIARGQNPAEAYAAASSEEETRAYVLSPLPSEGNVLTVSATQNTRVVNETPVEIGDTRAQLAEAGARERIINTGPQTATTPAGAPNLTGQFEGASTVVDQRAIFTTTGAARANRASPVKDFRLRISLAESANYLYRAARKGDILYPLQLTKGVIFPYTPQIQISYNANYESQDIAHSNYKVYNYRNSSVDSITISGEFTAQDTSEAEYVLAVIHFFKSVTKMFYGKDGNPVAGTPPPLCYVNGYGQYAFNNHPILIMGFTLNYPTDVDYINAGAGTISGQQLVAYTGPTRIQSLKRSGLAPGGITSKVAVFTPVTNDQAITRVPTKISISITAAPVITRNDLSNNFSLREYASGNLIKRGIW